MGAVAAGLAPSAAAYPPVWAAVRSKIVFAPGHKITGIRPAWTFDKRYTAMAVQGLYGDGDGVYSKEEFEPLAKINFDLLKELALTQGLFHSGASGDARARLAGTLAQVWWRQRSLGRSRMDLMRARRCPGRAYDGLLLFAASLGLTRPF